MEYWQTEIRGMHKEEIRGTDWWNDNVKEKVNAKKKAYLQIKSETKWAKYVNKQNQYER